MKIIFKNNDNSVGILIPTQEALSFATIEQIAEKDVPAPYEYAIDWDIDGNPIAFDTYATAYKIVNDTDIPTDRTYRDAWEWDSTWTPDGFGGESNEFDAQLLEAYYASQGV